MDMLLGRVTQQAVHYAIRSGISITTGYAIKECGRLLKQAPRGKEREELMLLQLRLESKIKVIAPSIDMIELIAARGNTSLESALTLCKDLRYDIQKLGQRLQKTAEAEHALRHTNTRASSREQADHELKLVINQIKLLLARIEDAVPLISLAITTSGVNLSTKLSGTISPSRLLQASTFLTTADTRFTSHPNTRHQVGPTYIVTLYMLFAGHAARGDDGRVRDTTWKEVMHKARIKLWRVPLEQLYSLPGEAEGAALIDGNRIPADAKSSEFAYQLTIVEDFDDGRVHTFEEGESQPVPFDDVDEAGIRDVVPIHEVSKIFYADTGKILNIGSDDEPSSPVLLLKRDIHAEPPRRMMRPTRSRPQTPEYDEEDSEQSHIDAQIHRESTPDVQVNGPPEAPSDAWRLPPDLDPEWLAFEVFTEDGSDTEDELLGEPERPQSSRSPSLDPGLTGALAHLKLDSPQNDSSPNLHASSLALSPGKRSGPAIKTTLSLLEMLMKLTALQQFRQESHLAIEDELLNFFLEDSATAGAGADKNYRQRIRHDAIKRVGFDPYDESPVKRRGEEYIRENAGSPQPQHDLAFNEDYEFTNESVPRLDFARQSLERLSPGRQVSLSPRTNVISQQTPSRSSTPDVSSDAHRSAVQAKYAAGRPSPSSIKSANGIVTPPTTQKNRSTALRAQSDPRPRSRLYEVSKASDEE